MNDLEPVAIWLHARYDFTHKKWDKLSPGSREKWRRDAASLLTALRNAQAAMTPAAGRRA